MEVRPGYKRTEVGVIPEDWEVRPLSSISGFITKGSTPTTYGFKWEPDGVLFLRSECVSERGLDLGQSMYISSEAHRLFRRSEARDGDVLMTITGNVGRVVILRGVGTVNLNQHIARIRVETPGVDPHYLFHWLSRPDVRARFFSITTGQAYPQISLEQVRDTEIPVPPLSEQRSIAAALEHIDALLASLDRLLAKKRDLKQAAMQQLLTGKVRLPGFSGEWAVRKLGSVAPLQRGFDLPNRAQRPGPYPVVYSNGVLTYHDRFLAEGPGVVTGRSGTIGKVTFIPGPFWPHNTALWVTSFNNCDPRFVFYLFTEIGLERFAGGSGVPTLNRNDVHSFEVSIPASKEEQHAIASVLSDMDAEIEALEGRREKTLGLKQAMMQELLTGKTRLL